MTTEREFPHCAIRDTQSHTSTNLDRTVTEQSGARYAFQNTLSMSFKDGLTSLSKNAG